MFPLLWVRVWKEVLNIHLEDGLVNGSELLRWIMTISSGFRAFVLRFLISIKHTRSSRVRYGQVSHVLALWKLLQMMVVSIIFLMILKEQGTIVMVGASVCSLLVEVE